jgi:vitamin B12 transporter
VHTFFLRFLVTFFLFLLCSLPSPASARAGQSSVTGIVVDAGGQPIGRALVTVRAASGSVVATTFTEADGRFRIRGDALDGCRVEATLAGFETAGAACARDQDVRLVLTIAPLQESVVVTATRSEVPSGQLGASVTVFDREDIERQQVPQVADLIRTAPGVMVVRTGGIGNQTSLFVRGGESNYNKVLLDGVPLNEPGGVFFFNNVTSENLERVELVRGAQSALFGSDAMASVVQMFTTRSTSDGNRGTAMFEAGTYDTVRGSAGVSGTNGRFDYSAHAAQYATNNRVPNDEFNNTTLSGTAGIELPSRASLRFVGRAELGKVGVPGQAAFGRPDLDAFFERDDGVVGVTFTQQISEALRQRGTYALAVSNQQSTNEPIDPPYTPEFEGRTSPFEFFDFPYDTLNELRRHHLSYQADWRVPTAGGRAGTYILTGAFDFDGERGTLSDRLTNVVTKASRNNAGYTVQLQALWPQLFVTGGLRVEDNSSFGVATVPRVSVAWIAHRGSGRYGDTKLKAAAGLGIKEPTIVQSFSPSSSFPGNPDLEPERSRSVEAGIEQRFLNDRAKVDFTWFDNRFEDIISTETISFNPFRGEYVNIGLTRARGTELTGELAPTPGIRVSAGYTFLASEVIEGVPDNVVFDVGAWLFRRPRHSGFAEVTGIWRKLTVDVTALFVGERVDNDFSALEPPMTVNEAYSLWNLRASYQFSPRLSVIGAVDNLWNEDYMEPLGYPALGRAGRLGVTARF